jgi:hypothetical protein
VNTHWRLLINIFLKLNSRCFIELETIKLTKHFDNRFDFGTRLIVFCLLSNLLMYKINYEKILNIFGKNWTSKKCVKVRWLLWQRNCFKSIPKATCLSYIVKTSLCWFFLNTLSIVSGYEHSSSNRTFKVNLNFTDVVLREVILKVFWLHSQRP